MSAHDLIDAVLGFQPASAKDGLNILVIDWVLSFGLPLAQRCLLDGHQVAYAPLWGPEGASPYASYLGNSPGLQTMPEGWMKALRWADLAVVTGVEHRGHVVEFLRANDVPTVGTTSDQTKLELDRQYGWEVAKAAGIKVPWQYKFTSLDSVKEFIEEKPGRYVLKLDQTVRDAGETLVGQDDTGRDLLDGIKRLDVKLDFAHGTIGFYLQQYVTGTEVSVLGFFNGTKFINDRLIVNYDGCGGFAYDLSIDGSHLVSKEALETTLREFDYRGPIDINGILTEQGEFIFLEWTPRWGSGMTEFVCHSVHDLGALLDAMVTGQDCQLIKDKVDDQVVVVVNARTENLDNLLYVTLPPNQSLPVYLDDRSFWAENAIRVSRDRWAIAPIQNEYRKARYVANDENLDTAIDKVNELAKHVRVSDCFVDSARALDELAGRVDTVREFVTSNWSKR